MKAGPAGSAATADAAAPRPPGGRVARPAAARWARGLLGLLLLALVALPVHRLLAGPETGLAGGVTVELTDTNAAFLWSGAALVLALGLLLALVVPPARTAAFAARAAAWLETLPLPRFALGLALFAGGGAALFGLLVLDGQPILIDSISQLVHARYIAAGRLAGPASELAEFWHIQNTLLVPAGWVSMYPPGYPVLLALGLLAGAPWLVGPLFAAATAFFTALLADRLLGADRAVARLGALLAALSPFALFLAGAYMSHTVAAAFVAMALYFGLRARDVSAAWTAAARWAAAAGAAIGAAFSIRPLVAAWAAALVAFGCWLPAAASAPRPARWLAVRLAGAAAAGLPFALAVGAYNLRLFGSPFRFGYIAASGPAHDLGFHVDPWGNLYGPLQALGYTAADLVALSLHLLETPLPAVAVVGLYLLVARDLPRGTGLLLAWALLPVAANLLYWHHGLFMGPRMLVEAAPAWAILTALAAVGLARAIPDRPFRGGRLVPRAAATLAFALAAVAGLAVLAPRRAVGHAPAPAVARARALLDSAGPALVFVHGAWSTRVAMRLAAAGMRLDSVEAAVRENSTCEAHRFAEAYARRARGEREVALPRLVFASRAGARPRAVQVAEGSVVRVWPEESVPAACARQLHADRAGTVDVAPLLWERDLPALDGDGPLVVRDMGPERNQSLRARFAGRPALVLAAAGDGGLALLPYDRAMRILWGREGS